MTEPPRELNEIERTYQVACASERRFRRHDWLMAFALGLAALVNAIVPATKPGFDAWDVFNYAASVTAALLLRQAMRAVVKRRRAFRELADSVHAIRQAARLTSPSAPVSKD